MKKLLLSLAVCLFSLGAMADDDAVSAKVSGTTLDIALTNSVEYVAFQMDITLPSGVSASSIAAVSDRLTQTGADNTIGSGKFIVASNVIDETNNIVRVIAYNLNNDAIAGTSGDNILTITLSAAPSASSDVKVENIIFVTKEGLAETSLNNIVGEDGYVMGDVDHSGKVDVNDVVATAKKALGQSPTPFYEAQAEVVIDGKIDVNDVVAIAKLSLGK